MTELRATVNRVIDEIFIRHHASLVAGTLMSHDLGALVLAQGFYEINTAFDADESATLGDLSEIIAEGIALAIAAL